MLKPIFTLSRRLKLTLSLSLSVFNSLSFYFKHTHPYAHSLHTSARPHTPIHTNTRTHTANTYIPLYFLFSNSLSCQAAVWQIFKKASTERLGLGRHTKATFAFSRADFLFLATFCTKSNRFSVLFAILTINRKELHLQFFTFWLRYDSLLIQNYWQVLERIKLVTF